MMDIRYTTAKQFEAVTRRKEEEEKMKKEEYEAAQKGAVIQGPEPLRKDMIRRWNSRRMIKMWRISRYKKLRRKQIIRKLIKHKDR